MQTTVQKGMPDNALLENHVLYLRVAKECAEFFLPQIRAAQKC